MFGLFYCTVLFQDFPTVSALELLIRANITVKSSIKHLVLRDATTQVLSSPPSCKSNLQKNNKKYITYKDLFSSCSDNY